MTNEQIRKVQFEWLLAWIIVGHCRHRVARQKIQHALYYLRSLGVVRRVGKDRWEAAK